MRKARNPLPLPAVVHPQSLLRLEQVLALLPIPKPSFYAGVKEGRYPLPVRISHRTVAWRASDILALMEGFEPTTDIDGNVAKAGAAAKTKAALSEVLV